jgi:hypothetical protein
MTTLLSLCILSFKLGDWATANLHSPRAHVMDPFNTALG